MTPAERGARRERRALDPGGHLRQPHRVEVCARDHGQPERIGHALAVRLAVCGEREHRLDQRLELERGAHLAEEARVGVAGVPEAMRRARLDRHDLAGPGDDLLAPAFKPTWPSSTSKRSLWLG